jgi:hypothetical protein
LAQVLNFQGKTVAFLVKRNKMAQVIYLPCAPSAIIANLQIYYIDNENIWQNYVATRDELMQLSELTGGNILCRPKIKVIEDELIVGILTETNQFIMINPPEENHVMDDLEELNETNYVLADINLANRRKKDNVRERTIKMIQLDYNNSYLHLYLQYHKY